ncbi:hypothetical protein CK203_022412 [Vitis vinifera]|uniref:Uncharacterized protein n=1 Tax=Vitis vinifera TaxID=29760 RepID=A0A438I937_VITVI|nr:hypothetical protein CK203_022412 [Vitis vinifera]
MTRKTMRNQEFEPWIFRSCLSYQHFVINDNNRDQRKKDSKKTSTTTVVKIKTEANVVEKASALVAATDYGDHMTFDSRQVSPLRPSSQKVVSTANGNTTPVIGEGSLTLTDTLNLDSILVVPSLDYNLLHPNKTNDWLCIKRGKLYYLDLQSKDSNKLQQALMTDGFEGRIKSLKFGCGIDVWDMLPLGEAITSAAYLINRVPSSSIDFQTPLQALTNATLDYNYPILKEDESGQSELVNQEAGELDMSDTTLEPSSNDHPKAEELIEDGRDNTIEPSE